METSDWILILLFASPVLAASYLFFAKYEAGIAKVDSIGDWLFNKQNQYANEDSFFSKYIIASLLWPFKKLNNFTDNIEDTFKQSGLRIIGFGYYGIALGYLVSAIVFGLVVLVMALLVLWFALYVLGQMSKDNDDDAYENDRKPKSKARERVVHRDKNGNVIGESIEKEGFTGKYTEHRDKNGNVIGESREREGFTGKYTEHSDKNWNKTGESREREGFTGKYTEHSDKNWNKTGESREREGFTGKYKEHSDKNWNKTGESREE